MLRSVGPAMTDERPTRRPMVTVQIGIAAAFLALILAVTSCDGTSGPPPEPIARLAAGADFTCAIDVDGHVICWGDPRYMGVDPGVLDLVRGISPPVAAALPDSKDFIQVTASRGVPDGHACALASDGSVWCWGELLALDDVPLAERGPGDGLPFEVRVPDSVTFERIASGQEHACAIDSAGAVWCWGSGAYGQRGDGVAGKRGDHPLDEATRVRLPEGVVITRIAAGGYFTCALSTEGAVWCWGDDGAFRPPALPVAIPLPPDAVLTDVVVGGPWVCALTSAGGVWCWDYPMSGNAYPGSTSRKVPPEERVGFGEVLPGSIPMRDDIRFTSLALGELSICALSEPIDGVFRDTGVWCWGMSDGYGVPSSDADIPFPSDQIFEPRHIPDTEGRGFLDLSVGLGHACAISPDGSVWCWGDNTLGQLGDTTTRSSLYPVPAHVELAAMPSATGAS